MEIHSGEIPKQDSEMLRRGGQGFDHARAAKIRPLSRGTRLGAARTPSFPFEDIFNPCCQSTLCLNSRRTLALTFAVVSIISKNE
jgi:hypothetical protein